jgi:hypothetical protein
VNPVLRPFALFVRYWPQLVACYLLGLLGRHWAIELAAWAGHENDWWAAVTMPLAAMARLGSYVAMFLVLRRAIPALADLPRKSARRIDVFATIVVPFFAVYLAWQLFKEDWIDFEARAQDYRIGEAVTSSAPVELHPDALPASTTMWALVAAALLCRVLLNLLKDRLPTWLVVVRVYVDSVWVFLVLTFSIKQGFILLVNPTKWLSERRIIVWLSNTRTDLFSSFHPLEVVWNFLSSAVQIVFGGATIPLMWLAVAGIVYGATSNATWRGAFRRTAGHRATVLLDRAAPVRQRVHGRWTRLPEKLREKSRDFVRSQLGKFEPIVDSARVILHGGVLALSLYVLTYLALAWLDMTGSFYGLQSGPGHLFRGTAWLLGPHPIQFWKGYSDTLALVSHMIIEPLRICVIASTFAYCLEHVAKSQHDAHQNPPAVIDDVDGRGYGVAGQQEAELQSTGFTALGGGVVGHRSGEQTEGLRPPTAGPVGEDAGTSIESRGPGPIDRGHE